MYRCPECGGTLRYERSIRMYVCTECGRMYTREELIRYREELLFGEERKKQDRAREYLDWWLSSNK